MASLSTLLQHLVAATLAAGCAHRQVGGGCPPSHADETLGPEVDEPLKQLLEACTSPETCLPVCEEVQKRGHHGSFVEDCRVTKLDDTHTKVTFTGYHQCAGRRPIDRAVGLAEVAGGDDPVAGWLARQGALEAASVRAFVELAEALRHHGAPSSLVDACLAAARDEAGHAALCGVTIAFPTGAPGVPLSQSIEQLAIDNAVEGEVRETWGAVTAVWQARAARSPQLRAIAARLAADELRHAELSAQLAGWYDARLDDAARARVAAAKRAAIEALVASAPAGTSGADELGMPDAADAARLFVGLEALVWSTRASAEDPA